MEYRGFTILHDKIRNSWHVKVDFFTEWLATDEMDAKRQIDDYLERKYLRNVA